MQHTYSHSAPCYPDCFATLTVTDVAGATATKSVLTRLDTNLLIFEDFNDNAADDFTVRSGIWNASNQIYTGSANGWGTSVSNVSCNNCVIHSDARSSSGTAYVVFDYVTTNNFKYAGFNVSGNKWVIGKVTPSGNQELATFTQTFSSGTWYTIEARLSSATGTVTLGDGTITKVLYSFGSLAISPTGLAVNNANSDFDNFRISPYPTQNIIHQQDFSNGAPGYVVVVGNWSVVSQAYVGSAGTGIQQFAISKTPATSVTNGILEADLKRTTFGAAWVIFDFVDQNNYKFAGFSISSTSGQWEIGQVVSGSIIYRNTSGGIFALGTSYRVQVLLEGSSTATLAYQNAIKCRYTFGSLAARPVALGVRLQSATFDNILIYTLFVDTNPGQDPPPTPPPTQNGGPPSGPITDLMTVPLYFHLNDHLGTSRIVANEAGNVVTSIEYFPFGELKSFSGCAVDKQQFTGKLFDNESALQYFGARYLSNDLTRFTSVDPTELSFHPKVPQSWNRYSYGLNNPITFQDLDGRIVVLSPSLRRSDRTRAEGAINQMKSTPTGSALYQKVQNDPGTFTVEVSHQRPVTAAERARSRITGKPIEREAGHFTPTVIIEGEGENRKTSLRGGTINFDFGIVDQAAEEPYNTKEGDAALAAHEFGHAAHSIEDPNDFQASHPYDYYETYTDRKYRDPVVRELRSREDER